MDPRKLRWSYELRQHGAEARMPDARDDVLPAIRLEHALSKLRALFRRDVATADSRETLGVGGRLRLQYSVDRADERNQVIHGCVALVGGDLPVFAPPFELIS